MVARKADSPSPLHPLVIVAWLTLRSWANKLGLLLFIGFILLLSAQQDLDWVRHLLHAGRYGLAFGLLIWIVSAIVSPRRHDLTAQVGMIVPWGRVMAPAVLLPEFLRPPSHRHPRMKLRPIPRPRDLHARSQVFRHEFEGHVRVFP
ncbi:MAG: hypothetical protein U0903_16375 [Planctomycetales bacterium]